MPTTNCLDISNYTGPLYPLDVELWKQDGIELVIVGLQYPTVYPYTLNPGVAHQQLQVLTENGMRVECYAESFAISSVWHRVQQFKPYIERIWVAAEEDHVDEAWLDAEFAFIDALNLPQRSGVYTGAWWWNWQPFYWNYTNRPVWLADYDGVLTPLEVWPHVTIWQHAGTSTFAGVNAVDLNQYFWIPGPPAMEQEEAMEEARVREIAREEVQYLRDELAFWQYFIHGTEHFEIDTSIEDLMFHNHDDTMPVDPVDDNPFD